MVTAAAVSFSCHCGGRGSGYGAYLLGHWLVHTLGWWALVPAAAFMAAAIFLRRGDDCS